jgi:hypothetical protein
MIWYLLNPRMTPEVLGFLPSFFDEDDPRPAREQIDANYQSGWEPFSGLTMLPNGCLSYPGDPPLHPLAETKLRDEIIRFYEAEWLAIIQPDGSWEVARVD